MTRKGTKRRKAKKTTIPTTNETATTTIERVDPDPHVWIKENHIESTEQADVPDRLIDQVIGQDDAVGVALKAAEQGRNLLLIGDPGTGKSMIAKAMAEVLPETKLPDVLVYHNRADANNPKVAQVDGGQGRKVLHKYERLANRKILFWRTVEYVVGFGTIAFGLAMWLFLGEGILAFLFSVLIALLFLYFMGQNRPKKEFLVPKLLLERKQATEKAPYVDATGSHAGALLGDVRHDPYQSGGLETPAHVRVDAGAIHRAHRGVLFIDEVNVLRLQSQQALLTAMQDKEYSIVGQSQNSSGANIRSERVPCGFILVAAGNLDAVQPPDPVIGVGMHPALRSRIRGYGYEVFVNDIMDDTHDNRMKMVQFVAQEVMRDGRIPHFTAAALAEVIREGQRRSGRTGKLTLRLRELGGLVRTAGDMARTSGAGTVDLEHVVMAKRASRSLEQQITQKEIDDQLDAEADITVHGAVIGAASGVASIGTGEVGEPAGLVVPVEAAVVPALSRSGGSIMAGERLAKAAGSSVDNVSAVLKVLEGGDLADQDVHVDVRIAHDEASADGVGLAIAVAAISALEKIASPRDTVFIAEITVSGRLRPVPATLQRIEAALHRGFKRAIVPAAISESLLLDQDVRDKIEIVHCDTIGDVVENVFSGNAARMKRLSKRLLEHAGSGARNGHGRRATANGTGQRRPKAAASRKR